MNALIIKDCFNTNQDGITDMEQTESWSCDELFKKTYPYEAPYLLELQKEGFIEDITDFACAIYETICLLEIISTALMDILKI
jgi:hypothetical protein